MTTSIIQEKLPAETHGIAAPNPCGRSAVSNGNRLFVSADGRSKAARRFKDIYRDLLYRTHGCHEILVRSVASLCLRREEIESRMARGEAIDTAELVSVAGAISRIMSKIGLTADADDEPAEDGTQAAIAALRSYRSEEAA